MARNYKFDSPEAAAQAKERFAEAQTQGFVCTINKKFQCVVHPNFSLVRESEYDYEIEYAEALSHAIHPGAVVFDVGANVGILSMAMAQLTGATGTVYAFEPVKQCVAYLKYHQDRNQLRQLVIVPGLVSDKVGEGQIHVNQADKCFVTSSQYMEWDSAGTETVPMGTLDIFIGQANVGRVDVIKIDVEGAEGAVLAGAKALLARDMPDVLLEFHPDCMPQSGYPLNQVLQDMQGLGYWPMHLGSKKWVPWHLVEEVISRYNNRDWLFSKRPQHYRDFVDAESLPYLPAEHR